jgi:subtilase family serine protease
VSNLGHVAANSGGVQVNIDGALSVGTGGTILPGAGLAANQLSISVGAVDAAGGIPAVSLGANSVVTAVITAPRGTLSVGTAALVTGAFAAFDIELGNLVQLNFQSGLPTTVQQGSQQLSGYVDMLPPNYVPIAGPVPPSTMISLEIGLPAQPGLQAFADAVSDPKSPLFRQYITNNTDFLNRYGGNSSDYQKVMDWADGANLTVVNTFPDFLLMSVQGTAAQIEAAFNTNLVLRNRSDGSQFLAVDREPSANIVPTVLWVSGFDDFLPIVPLGGTSPIGGSQNYWGYDYRNAYFQGCLTLPDGTVLDGTGESIGIMAMAKWQSNTSDISAYDTGVNAAAIDPTQAPALNPSNVIDAGTFNVQLAFPGGLPGGVKEVIADIETAHSMAPGAQILAFTGDASFEAHNDSLYYAVANHTPYLSAVTNSFAIGFSKNAQQALWEMAAHGTSVFVASGDFGNVGDPMDSNDMDAQTLVGGTILNTNGTSTSTPVYPTPYYSGETSWVDGNGTTSGGVMDHMNMCYALGNCPSNATRPPYQASLDVSTNGGSLLYRNYPDVSMGVYMTQNFNNNFSSFVGTSVASPLWAGVAALIDQRARKLTAGLLGFPNPAIYEIGATRGTTDDIYHYFATILFPLAAFGAP